MFNADDDPFYYESKELRKIKNVSFFLTSASSNFSQVKTATVTGRLRQENVRFNFKTFDYITHKQAMLGENLTIENLAASSEKFSLKEILLFGDPFSVCIDYNMKQASFEYEEILNTLYYLVRLKLAPCWFFIWNENIIETIIMEENFAFLLPALLSGQYPTSSLQDVNYVRDDGKFRDAGFVLLMRAGFANVYDYPKIDDVHISQATMFRSSMPLDNDFNEKCRQSKKIVDRFNLLQQVGQAFRTTNFSSKIRKMNRYLKNDPCEFLSEWQECLDNKTECRIHNFAYLHFKPLFEYEPQEFDTWLILEKAYINNYRLMNNQAIFPFTNLH